MSALLLGLGLLAALGVAAAAFVQGDRRRREALGGTGPRPLRSIGEALSQARRRGGRVLVLFLGRASDPLSAETARAVAEDPQVLRLLARPDILHVVVRDEEDAEGVSAALFEKYAGEPPPAGPACLLLARDGERIGVTAVKGRGPLGTWLPAWAGGA